MNAAAIATALNLRHGVGACPACGYKGAFTVQDRDGATLVKCHAGCSQEDAIAALRGLDLWSGNAPYQFIPRQTHRQPTPKADRSEAVLGIWQKTIPGTGTLAESYLRTRGITLAVPPTIRFAPALKHAPSGFVLPAMVAAVSRWPSNRVVGLHRTYLRNDGAGKADISTPKMTLGDLGGGAVRLAPRGPVLIVGEGLETTLSAMQATGLPGWAALSTGGMRALILPDDVSEVIVAADADAPGLEAAYAAAERWTAEGRKVRIALPPTAGADWNDMIQGEAA